MGNAVLEGTKLKISSGEIQKGEEQKSAYSKPGCDPELLKEMALEALAISEAKGHSQIQIKLINQSDTPCTIFMNGKAGGLANPTETITVKGLGIDLLLGKCMENVDAKADYGYAFGSGILRNIVKKYTEFDHTFPHPAEVGKCYLFNFKSPTPDSSVVTLTLTDNFTDPKRNFRETTQKEGESDEPQASSSSDSDSD
jgi:hypothetical protein